MKQLFIFLVVIISTGFANHRVRRLVGGQNARRGQFPYQASIYLLKTLRHRCGGSILNDRFILTAAHCIYKQKIQELAVKVGSHKLSKGGKSYFIEEMRMHQNYNTSFIFNDIALIRVNKDIIFNHFVQPISIDSKITLPQNANLTVSGWGSIRKVFKKIPNNLQFSKAKFITLKECNKIYSEYILIDMVLLMKNQFCTLPSCGHGICNGDSGSPIVYDKKLIGIASWKAFKYCAIGFPDVYTNVTKYITWIRKTMNKMNNYVERKYKLTNLIV